MMNQEKEARKRNEEREIEGHIIVDTGKREEEGEWEGGREGE